MDPTRMPLNMRRLPTDRRGLPVPYVNAWGAENADRIRIWPDPLVAGPGVFVLDDRDAGPDFKRQNMGRQRECVLAGLCQVCARPLPWKNRFLVIAALSVETITLDGRRVLVVTEPWLCVACCAFAVGVCPELIRRSRDEQLEVVRITGREQVRLVMSKGYVDGPLEAESRRVMPAMWGKILLVKGGEPGSLRSDAAARSAIFPEPRLCEPVSYQTPPVV